MALALAAMVAMAMVPAAHASAPTPHYARAIACAAGDATLAAMLGGEAAQGDDRNTVARLNTLSARWLELALAEAGNASVVRADLARSKAAIANDVARSADPASLSAMLDARLAPCASLPGDDDASAT